MARKNNNYKKHTKKDSKGASSYYENKDEKKDTKYESKGRGKSDRSKKQVDGMNDVAWYAANPQLLKDAASLSFYNPSGRPFHIGTANAGVHGINVGNAEGYNCVPGVAALTCLCEPGISKDATSAVNISARAMYGFIRHVNSGARNYEASDLAMYINAMDSAYSWYAFLVRVYGTLRMYDQANVYFPNTLLRANGVSTDLQYTIADFRSFLNTWTLKLSTLFVPNVMPLITRHVWMFSNYYMDDPSLKGQVMFYRPAAYYTYDPHYETGGRLVSHNLIDYYNDDGTHGPMTFQEIIRISNEIIEPLLSDEDIGIMGGDILKAYGEGNLVKLATVPDDYIVLPVYNTEVLEQMKHATYFSTIDYTTCNIEQRDNVVKFDPEFIVNDPGDLGEDHEVFLAAFMNSADPIFNFGREGIEPDDVMVASRLMTVPDYKVDSSHEITLRDGSTATVPKVVTAKIQSCGTEILVGTSIYFNRSTSDGVQLNSGVFNSSGIVDMGFIEYSELMTLYTDFKWLPRVALFNVNSDAAMDINPNLNRFTLRGYLEDMCNYTPVDKNVITKLHNCAIMSEWNVPRIGLVQ